MCDILTRFRAFFGERGGDQVPGNTGEGRHLSHLCREALFDPNPVLFEYYEDWHSRPDTTPLVVANRLVQIGMREAAWNVVQLHFDQTQKIEARDGVRLHKGDPACGMAILGQVLGSNALVRHHALLSSAGDIYWEHQNADLRIGGLGPTGPSLLGGVPADAVVRRCLLGSVPRCRSGCWQAGHAVPGRAVSNDCRPRH